MNFPCANSTYCSGDFTLGGFSSENPDALTYFPAQPYSWPPGRLPAYQTPSTTGFYPPCASTVSQAAADACAALGN